MAPSPPPPIFDVSKVPLPGRYPATFLPTPQPGFPVASPAKEDHVSYYLGYPAPQPAATYGPNANSLQAQGGWGRGGGGGGGPLQPLTFYSQAYPGGMTAMQPARIPK